MKFMKLIWLFLICGPHLLYSQSTPQPESTTAQAKKTFSLNPQDIGALQNSINLVTGQASFPMNVASLPGKGGLNASVSFEYNSGGTKRQVKLDNQNAPTGVLGMGWSIGKSQIVVDNKGTGARQDDDFFFVDGGAQHSLICLSYKAVPMKFACRNFMPWIIYYYPDEEKWVVTREDGSQYIYGQSNSGRNTVQWMVRWHNWIGNTTNVTNQAQTAYVWNLSEIHDVRSNKMLFTYTSVEEYVAYDINNISTQKQHTQASYLSKISDPIGQTIELNYSEKLVNEYVDPHAEQREPDAYQEKYETRYLDNINVKLSSGQLLYSVTLNYTMLDMGNCSKRFLTQIQKRFPNNATEPAIQFEYFDDGDSKGFLKKVINSLGAHIDYYYQKVSIPNSDRRIFASNPGGYGEPQVFLENDYAVVTWRKLKSDGTKDTGSQPVKIFAYYWDGRWIGEELWTTAPITQADYLQASIALSDRHFMYRVVSGNLQNLYMARKRTNYSGIGQWVKQTQILDDYDGAKNEKSIVLSGDNFVAYLSRGRNIIYTYVWKKDSWNWQPLVLPENNFEVFATGTSNYIFVHNDNGGSADVLHFYYLDLTRNWNERTLPSSLSVTADGDGSAHDNYWHGANTYVVGLPVLHPEYIYTWDENYENFIRHDVLGSWKDNSQVSLQNSQLAITDIDGNSIVARFDGNNWRIKGPFNNATPSHISLGEDIALWDKGGARPNEVHLSVFDPNPYSGAWLPDQKFILNDLGNVEAYTGYDIQAGYNMISFKDGLLYARSPDGSWNYTNKVYLEDPEKLRGNKTFLRTPDFVANEYSTPDLNDHNPFHGTYVTHLENNQIKGYDRYPGRIFNPTAKEYRSRGSHIGLSTVALYLEADPDAEIMLLRVLDGASSGDIMLPVANYVVWTDGNKLYETTYKYENGKADPSGQVVLFNHVTAIAGSNSEVSRPNGATEHYFYNGLPESLLVRTPAAEGAGVEVGLLTGLPYEVDQVNSSAQTVSKTQSSYRIHFARISSSEMGIVTLPFARLRASKQTLDDGLTTATEIEYSDVTGLPLLTIVKNSDGINQEGDYLKKVFKYYWEAYDPDRSENILSPVIQVTTYKNEQPKGSVVTKWKLHSEVNALFPEEGYTWQHTGDANFTAWDNSSTPSTDWMLTSRITKLDLTDGTALEATNNQEILSASIFNENHTRVLAGAKYASLDEIAYSGFEETSTGNWSYDPFLIVSSDALSGSASFFSADIGGPNFNYISKNVPQGVYDVSCWSKVNMASIDVSAGSVLKTLTLENRNGWSLLKFQVDVTSSTGVIRIKVPVNGLVDEIRLKPTQAEMTTMVYDKIGNLINQTDNNLIQTQYEYDAQYRLTLVRDHKNRIVKKQTYHYRNQ